MSDVRTVVNTGLVPFGGVRITDGVSQAILWSDGVVLASAWSMSTPGIAGTIFDFRGTVTKGHPMTAQRHRWMVRGVLGEFIADFATRTEAVQKAAGLAQLSAIRGLNAVNRRKRMAQTAHDHMWESGDAFTGEPIPWASQVCTLCGWGTEEYVS